MRVSLASCSRIPVVTQTAKHLTFRWHSNVTYPEQTVIVFSRDDDYFFGVILSRVHNVWAHGTGTQLRDAKSGFRYTPTTCFQTFPFPIPTREQRDKIAAIARELDTLRSRWLDPPEWVRQHVLEFPGSVDGPWAARVSHPDEHGIGTVSYSRLVPMDDAAERALKKRTLTRLYNERPTWLQDAHRLLDEAVFAAYGWDPAMTDKELLALVLERNLTSHKEPSRVPNVNPIQPELPILRPVVPKPSVHPAKHREPKAPRMLKAALAAKRRGQKKKAS